MQGSFLLISCCEMISDIMGLKNTLQDDIIVLKAVMLWQNTTKKENYIKSKS